MWGYAGLIAVSILFLAVRSLRPAAHTVTAYELKRRHSAAALEAEKLKNELSLPLLGLRRLASGLLLMAIAVTAVGTAGLLPGMVWAAAVVLLCEGLSRLGFISRAVKRTGAGLEPKVLGFTAKLASLLGYFAGGSYMPPDAPFYSKDELAEQIRQDRLVLSEDEKHLMIQALAYEETELGAIMTVSGDIVGAEADETIGPVALDRLHKSGHRWFPVANSDHTDVVGVLDLNDAVMSRDIKTVGDVMNPSVYYLHERMGCKQAIHAFLRTGSPLFIVVDDSYEVVGMLTMADIFRQLLGRNPVNEFERYDDIEAVAEAAKENNHENTSTRTEQ